MAVVERSTYTEAFKKQILEHAAEHGVVATYKHFKLPKQTVRQWCERAGVALTPSAHVMKQTEAMRAEQEREIAETRERVRKKFIRIVDKLGDRIEEIGSGIAIDRNDAAVLKDVAITGAILLDKFRLESGEVTARESVVDERSAAEALGAGLDELGKRRSKRAAN